MEEVGSGLDLVRVDSGGVRQCREPYSQNEEWDQRRYNGGTGETVGVRVALEGVPRRLPPSPLGTPPLTVRLTTVVTIVVPPIRGASRT